MGITKQDAERYLNDAGIPEQDKRSNGGRVMDSVPYGTWMRRNDPIQFDIIWKQYNRKGEE